MAHIYKRLNFDPIGGANTAVGVSYDNSNSSLSATNVQSAIDELDSDIQGEIVRAIAEEAQLQSNIDDEEAARISADEALQDEIDAVEADLAQEILDRQAADALLIPLSQKGQPNGVATLDGAGLVPAAQLPSYVDDVLEFPTLSAFPVSGETGKIYVAIGTGRTYRCCGSTYIQINPGLVTSVFTRIGDITAENGDYIASQITNIPSGNLASTEVQAALNELQSDVDTRALQTDLAQEIADRIAADELLQDNIDAEVSRATAAENVIADDVSNLVTLSGVPVDSTNLGTFTGTIIPDNQTNKEAFQVLETYSQTLANDIEAIELAVADHETRIDTLETDLAAEIVRATDAEELIQDNLDAHINDTTGAHTASAITNVPTGNLSSTDVQSALNELQSQIDNTVSGVSSVFGRTGAVVAVSGDYSAEQVTFDGTASGLTATEVQAAIDELAARPVGAPGDITLTSFTFAASQTGADVTGLSFDSTIRSFQVLLSVETATLYESFTLNGIQKASNFFITELSRGDDSGVTFDITPAGQVTYSSGAETGIIKFRAIIT